MGSFGTHKAKSGRHKSCHAFGDPDGQRSEIDDDFVPFQQSYGDLSTGDKDFEARLIIGRKGSGKTLYMRRLHASASKSDEYFATEIEYRPPDTETVYTFSRHFTGEGSQIEWWAKLWSRCISRSLVSHMTAGRLSEKLDKSEIDKIKQFSKSELGGLIRNFVEPLSPCRQMEEIATQHHVKGHFIQFLQSPYWSDLEALLSRLLRKLPPVFLFLDALDENFERFPHVWLKCQAGLFQYAIQSLRDNSWNRLHLTVSLRDVVHASMMRSEHRTRFIGDSHIRLLNWDSHSITEFFQVKLDRLHKRHFLNFTKGQRTENSWLGLSEVTNIKKNVKEPALHYILRHTRLLPRDLIIICNEICDAIDRGEHSDQGIEAVIRNQAHESARTFGEEQFKLAAEEILSSTYSARPGRKESRPDDEYATAMTTELQSFVQKIGKDRFSRAEFLAAESEWKKNFESDVFSPLWRNGLVGCIDMSYDADRFLFYNHDSLNSFELPSNAVEFVFHPIVIDATGIKSVSPSPIVPYPRGRG